MVFAGLGLAAGLLPARSRWRPRWCPALLALGGARRDRALAAGARGADGERGGRLRARWSRAAATSPTAIRDAISLLGSGRPLIVLGAIGYMALDVIALAAVFAAFGGGAPSLGVFVLAYAVGQLGGLVPLPGGVGGTDGGLILAFGLLGTPVAVAAAAVLGYRAFQLGVPAILGLAAFALAAPQPRPRGRSARRRTERRRDRAARPPRARARTRVGGGQATGASKRTSRASASWPRSRPSAAPRPRPRRARPR